MKQANLYQLHSTNTAGEHHHHHPKKVPGHGVRDARLQHGATARCPMYFRAFICLYQLHKTDTMSAGEHHHHHPATVPGHGVCDAHLQHGEAARHVLLRGRGSNESASLSLPCTLTFKPNSWQRTCSSSPKPFFFSSLLL